MRATQAPRTLYVRPWALAAPILLLLICIPLLRPLRQPDPRLVSDDERARLATIQAIVERKTLAIENTDFYATRDKIAAGGHLYSSQPPMLAVLLSGPYWIMNRVGLTLDHDPAWATFWLTLLGVTLPVALSAGLVYRMGRIFELRRPLRAGLGLGVVLGSGLVAYGTALNAHAPAAALLLAAVACFFHVTIIKEPGRGIYWIGIAGLLASLAACIDPPAVIFLILLLPVAMALRWPLAGRAAGVALYVIAAAAPILLHARLVIPMTGDWKPGLFHPELMATDTGSENRLEDFWLSSRHHPDLMVISEPDRRRAEARGPLAASDARPDEEDDEAPGFWRLTGRRIVKVLGALFGAHGIFSHFPILLAGIVGVSLVMHRHWPATTKIMAASTLAGASVVIIIYAMIRPDAHEAMFATQWFVVFLPLVLFWAGVWLRRPHHQATWIAAAVLLIFSVSVSIIGATGPLPRDGFDRYSVVEALQNLRKPPLATELPPILADRRDLSE